MRPPSQRSQQIGMKAEAGALRLPRHRSRRLPRPPPNWIRIRLSVQRGSLGAVPRGRAGAPDVVSTGCPASRARGSKAKAMREPPGTTSGGPPWVPASWPCTLSCIRPATRSRSARSCVFQVPETFEWARGEEEAQRVELEHGISLERVEDPVRPDVEVDGADRARETRGSAAARVEAHDAPSPAASARGHVGRLDELIQPVDAAVADVVDGGAACEALLGSGGRTDIQRCEPRVERAVVEEDLVVAVVRHEIAGLLGRGPRASVGLRYGREGLGASTVRRDRAPPGRVAKLMPETNSSKLQSRFWARTHRAVLESNSRSARDVKPMRWRCSGRSTARLLQRVAENAGESLARLERYTPAESSFREATSRCARPC